MFQSTRPVRDATICTGIRQIYIVVSIHASRAGRDPFFASHALLCSAFQSTRPVRDATYPIQVSLMNLSFQSTRPVRDATRFLNWLRPLDIVSIHASRAGRDSVVGRILFVLKVSIHASRAGRDVRLPDKSDSNQVSIHASRAGRDCNSNANFSVWNRFNPRVPCGTRRAGQHALAIPHRFNPRVPCGTRH